MLYLVLIVLGLLTVPVEAETIALALSGGGARGFAHIGVLKALDEAGLEPDLIVGSSMGAVIGGLYAAGYSAEELEHIALNTNWQSIFLDKPERRTLFLSQKETTSRHIVALGFRGWKPEVPVALAPGQGLSDLLFDLTQRAPYRPWSSFDDLRVPFRSVATDLNTGKAVVFRSGDLAEALRGSISMPLLFKPYALDTLLLVDGGVSENIPVSSARSEGATYVVAVDATSPLEATAQIDWPWQLLDRVTTMMQNDRNHDARGRADLMIVPALGNRTSTDYEVIASAIDSGYSATVRMLPQLKQKFVGKTSTVTATFTSRSLLTTLPAFESAQNWQFRFEGIRSFADSSLESVPTGAGAVNKLDLVRRMLMDKGYTLAHVTRIRKAGDTLVTTWDEGRIANIGVFGVQRSKPERVSAEFPLRKGDTFALRRARHGLSQIYGSDLFESVTLGTTVSDSGALLSLRVTEPPSPLLKFGAAYSSERKGRGFVEFTNYNVLALGARMRIFGKYGELDEQLSGAISLDRLPLDTPLDRYLHSHIGTDLKVGWRKAENYFYDSAHERTGGFTMERSEADLGVSRSFRRWGELTYAARYEYVRSSGLLVDPDARLAAMGVRTHIDTKDRYQFPTRGFQSRARYEYVIQFGQTRRAYNRVLGFADLHMPLAKRTILHGRADYGWNDRIMPVWGQYAIGGAEELLGLHSLERYGNTKVAMLGEVRYDLLSRWIADTFVSALYTAGGVSSESHTLPGEESIRQGVGASVGMATFLGPMKLTYGELIKSEHETGQGRLYLELGYDF